MNRLLVLVYVALLGIALLLQFHRGAISNPGERFDDPVAREAYDQLRLRDPATGVIPRGMRGREVAFAERIEGVSFKAATSIHSTTWEFAGPDNAGGRTQSIGVDIANESILIAATAQGGIWRSTDTGTHWSKATAPDQLQNSFSLVQDHRTGRTGTWYCGTGELLSTTFRRAQVVTTPRWRTLDVGDGIYKSTDNGKTWDILPSTFDTTEVVLDSAFDGVWNIVTDNTIAQQDVLYAAGYGAIMRSSDGGSTWQKVLGDSKNKSFCSDVAITSTGVLYAYLSSAGTGSPATAGIWRSVDGVTWNKITPTSWPALTIRMKLAIAPSNESIVYVVGEAPKYASGHSIWKYQYKSGNGAGAGGVWQDRSNQLPSSQTPGLEATNTLGGYALALAIHPLDPDMVYLGGTDVYRSSNGFADDLSTDWIGGYNPDPNGGQSYTNHHPDNHCFTFSPTHPERMYNANDAGVFVTDSSRATASSDDPYHPVVWSSLNAGLRASIVYVAAIDPITEGDFVISGGFQDQGAWIGRPGEPWDTYTGGDGCYTAIAGGKTAFYTSSQFANIYRLRFDESLKFTSYSFVSPVLQNPQFVAPWILDPTDDRQMYCADSNRVWWNSNLEDIPESNYNNTDINWSVLNPCTQSRGVVISALAVSTIPAHQLYFGTSDGHIYSYAQKATKTNELTSSLFPKNAFVSCIAVDPTDASHLIVCFSNYHVVSLFASDNGGTTWRSISGNLEEYPDGSGDGPSTRWVSIIHRQGLVLYLVSTSVGLYSSTNIDGPVTWVHESPNGIGRTIVEQMAVRASDGFVAVATQGAGIWYGSVIADSTSSSVAPQLVSVDIRLYPNPVSNLLKIDGLPPGSVTIKLFDESARLVKQVFNSHSIDCSALSPGNYSVEFETETAECRRRFVIRR
jgi:photosystem II stability/assembly factor-like uncharacterized protein